MDNLKIGRLWSLFAALFALLIAVAGLVQFGEYTVEYLPSVTSWLQENSALIAWVLLAISFIVNVLTLFILSASSRQRIEKDLSNAVNKIVLFVTPASGGEFYREHFSRLVRNASILASPSMKLHIAMVCPAEDFHVDMSTQLREAFRQFPAIVSGILYIPPHPDSDATFAAITEVGLNVPIVLVDVNASANVVDEVPKFDFVGGDEVAGGTAAASLATQWLRGTGHRRKVRIIVLKGRSNSWESQRVESFTSNMLAWARESDPSVDLDMIVSPDLNYDREEAARFIDQILENGTDVKSIDLIYACNDDMAVGSIAVLSELRRRGIPYNRLPRVIGYDGTSEMKRLMNSENPFCIGTIDVSIEEQSRRAILRMMHLIDSKSSAPTLDLIPPRVLRGASLKRLPQSTP